MIEPQKTVRQLIVHVKKKTSSANWKVVVYEVPGKDCELKCIGETKRSLKTRMVEHKYAVHKGDEQKCFAVHQLGCG